MTALYDDALAAAGVKITQFSLLRAIERNEPAAISALSEDLDLDRTTLARNLNPLQRDSLVELAEGSDRRVTEVRLTARGRAALAKALPLWQKVQADIAGRFEAGRLDQLRAIAAQATALAGVAATPALRVSPRKRQACTKPARSAS